MTLAQVVRLAELAKALDPALFEVHFASAEFSDVVFEGTAYVRHRIGSVSPAHVERSIRRGARLYGRSDLRRYLADDLRVIDTVQPELIVGDLRWSLLVAAPLRKVRYAALINAYWSPHRERNEFPLPAHPIVRLLGMELAGRYFPRALPFVFRHFAAPLNALRREHGLPELAGLQEVLTSSDLTLHPDVPELVPMRSLPAHHAFIGPVPWSPRVPLPPWWSSLTERKKVYVTMGSSGDLRVLPRVLDAVATLPVEVMVATAGRLSPDSLPRNVFAADYLPGDEAARRASVVICNGGSSTGYQAIAAGAPVLGVPFNLDQFLAMDAMKAAGCGELVRSDAFDADGLRKAVMRALDGEFAEGVSRIQAALNREHGPAHFARLVSAGA